jgi:hypothetical protein
MSNELYRPIMRLVLNELCIHHEERMNTYKYCANQCGNDSDEHFSTEIFWHKFHFCSEWCMFDFESDIRKSYRMNLRTF